MQFCLLLPLVLEAAVMLPAHCECGSYCSANNEGKRQDQAFIDSHELAPCMKSCDQRGSPAEPSASICLLEDPCLCGRDTSVLGTVDNAWHVAPELLCIQPYACLRTGRAAAGFTSHPNLRCPRNRQQLLILPLYQGCGIRIGLASGHLYTRIHAPLSCRNLRVNQSTLKVGRIVPWLP